MALSVREQVLVAVKALLAIPGYTVHRDPNYEAAARDLPALLMLDGGDATDSAFGMVLALDLRLTVVLCVKAQTTDALGAALSDGRAKVLQALAADSHLGGLASGIVYDGSEDPVILDEEGAVPPYAAWPLNFTVKYQEAQANPYQVA